MIRAALRSLLARKLRLLMSGVAIALGVAFVAGSLMFSDSLSRSFTALFSSTVGDVVVEPDSVGLLGDQGTETVSPRVVERLAALPGAARADGMVSATGVFVLDQEGAVVGGIGAPTFGAAWSDAPAGRGLEPLSILEGREPERSGEVVLDDATAEEAGYGVGDTASVLLSTREKPLEATVVGISGFSDGGSLNGATYTAFDRATAQDLFLEGRDAFTSVWVTAATGVSQDDLRDQVLPVIPDGLGATTGDDLAEDSATGLLDGIDFLTTLLLIFAAIALVVGAFLIVNTFSVLLAQRTRELALLRALGASRRQVVGSVLLEALLLGLLGATLGLGLGVLLAHGLRALLDGIGLELGGDLPLTTQTVLVSYAVGIVVTVAAAYLPARRTGRLAPVQALRDDVALPETSVRRRFVLGALGTTLGAVVALLGLFADLDHSGWQVGLGLLAVLLGVTAMAPVLARPFLLGARALFVRTLGMVGTLAGQNALRNPRRTAATASALMIGLSLVTTLAVIGDSAKASVDKAVASNFVGDFVVGNVAGATFAPTYARRLAQVDGVEQVVRLRFAPIGIDDTQRGLIGTDGDALDLLGVDLVSGSAEAFAEGGVLLDADFAADRGLEVGDDVEATAPAGERDLRVAGTFAENPLLPFPVVATIGTLVDAGYRAEDNVVIVDAADSSDATEARLAAAVADNPVIGVQDERQFAAERREPIDRLLLVLVALLGLALVIAVLGVVNTLALSVLERTREIGLLRAVGTSRRQVRAMVVAESVVISTLGALLGVGLGVVFGAVTVRSVRDQGLEVLAVPVTQLVAFVVVAVVVGVLAALLPGRRAARLDVLTAISRD